MSKKFYISDWHYGHENIISLDNRPFKTLDEMNGELIKRWNNVVSSGDIVYVLGDMFWCNTEEAIGVLDRLNGQKFLIQGNHDRCKDGKFQKRFVKITEYLEVDDENNKVILCHYPIPCFKNHFYGWYHLYGHVHNSFEAHMMEHDKYLIQELYGHKCNMFNVGVMMPWMDYTPRTLEQIEMLSNGWKEVEE
jgi:calcineurin-like phosphoesterase family protein